MGAYAYNVHAHITITVAMATAAAPYDGGAGSAAVDRALASGAMRIAALDAAMREGGAACAALVREVMDTAAAASVDGASSPSTSSSTSLKALRARRASEVERRAEALYALADARVATAQGTYDAVDDAITRLDRDLAVFEEAVRARDRSYDDLAVRNGSGERGFDGGGFDGGERGFINSAYDAPVANPNEPTYCICQQVSFGEMIACENDDCPIEWYHFSCVGLSVKNKVKGKWICPTCKRREGGRR